jgi:dCTP deaminase
MMGVLSDAQIKARKGMIVPCCEGIKKPGKVSFGVSSYGYDCRVGSIFKVFTPTSPTGKHTIIDPKEFSEDSFITVDVPEGDYVIIPPNSFALAETIEYFNIPRDILVLCIGKSSYARCGIIINVTPLEPEWQGKITIEISNSTPLPAKIYAGEGIAQLVFLRADQIANQISAQTCEVSYADKNGKYQRQSGIELPRVD